jgi:hypothetical protein
VRILEILANGRTITANGFYSALIVNLLVGFSASLKKVDPLAELRFECHEQKCNLLCQGEPIELKPIVESLLADVTMTLILRLNDVDPDDRVEFFIGPDTDMEIEAAE